MKKYERINIKQVDSESDPFTEDRYRQFYNYFPKESVKVLDIGCNTGRGGKILKDLNSNLQIYGLDAVKKRIEQLPAKFYEQAIHSEVPNIPFPDCTFDIAVAGEFIEHLYPNDVDATLAEVFRVLKIGGRFLLTTPSPNDIKRKFRKESILSHVHVSQHFPNSLKQRLRMTGFSSIKIVGSGKVTRYLGDKFPFFQIYGSYLAMGDKF